MTEETPLPEELELFSKHLFTECLIAILVLPVPKLTNLIGRYAMCRQLYGENE